MSLPKVHIGNVPNIIKNCPHCGVANPRLTMVWQSGSAKSARMDGKPPEYWMCFVCSTCAGILTAKGTPGVMNQSAYLAKVFPSLWLPSEHIPERTANYLTQANRTLSSPDASVIMSAASIDSILKDQGLKKGSLYERINKAVDQGIITKSMSEWAHRVRLDANSPRHADETDPHMTADEASRAFNFAQALAEIIYVLPSKMPPKPAPKPTA